MISSPLTAVYNPRAFIPHAASLRQTFVHCGRFSTAATRRCPDSVSVPVVGAMLSHPLDIIAMVGHYPTIKLISHQPLLRRNLTFDPQISSGITHSFPWLSPTEGYVPMHYYAVRRSHIAMSARLACLIHAANVHSEPGSNPSKICLNQHQNCFRRSQCHGRDTILRLTTKQEWFNTCLSFRSKNDQQFT